MLNVSSLRALKYHLHRAKGLAVVTLEGGTFIWAGMARQQARTSIDAWLPNTYKAAELFHLIAKRTQEKCIKNPARISKKGAQSAKLKGRSGLKSLSVISYITQFITTEFGYDPASKRADVEGQEAGSPPPYVTRRYSKDIGKVLSETTSTSYRLTCRISLINVCM